MVWTLDYDKTSDFDDCCGHWHVTPISETHTRVYYACDIKTKGHVPGPIMNYISKAALKQATGWVKKESEANPDATIPKEYGGTGGKAETKEEVRETELVGAKVGGGGSSSSSSSARFARRGIWGSKQ